MFRVRSGTVSVEQASVEQIPTEWMTLQNAPPPRVGDFIRVVNGRESSVDENSAVIRVDKTLTAVWRVPAGTEDSKDLSRFPWK